MSLCVWAVLLCFHTCIFGCYYAHIYIYIYIYINIDTRRYCTYMYTCIYTCIHMYIHIFVYMYVCIYICMYVCVNIDTRRYWCACILTQCRQLPGKYRLALHLHQLHTRIRIIRQVCMSSLISVCVCMYTRKRCNFVFNCLVSAHHTSKYVLIAATQYACMACGFKALMTW